MVSKDNISEKESIEKKRRKTSNVDASTSRYQKEDIYENVINYEEQEAFKRSPEKDIALFHHTCDDLKKIFEEVAALKKENSEKIKTEIQEKRIQGSLMFVLLKKINRLDKVRIRAGRDALHKEKLRVDSNRLQLQNLLYESNHLKREVQRCYQFKSQDEEIDLVSENEFYEKAPQSISRPDKTKSDEHARRLARLEWELQQRKQLSTLSKELTIAKENASKNISAKTERLDSLVPRLEALLKATKPLQEALKMNIEKEWEIQRSARLLPRPLYLVYVNLSAYAEACMPQLSVIIEGDEEEAKQFELDEKKDKLEEEGILDSDTEESEMNDIRKKHHKRQLSSKFEETADDKLKYLLKYHPLSVTFKIAERRSFQSGDSSNGIISVNLRYLPVLDFVLAKSQISIQNIGVSAGAILSENILDCLYTDDFGDVSPNPKTKYQLQNYGINEEKLIKLLTECNIGKPFKWAQKLCGIEFISQYASVASTSNNSAVILNSNQSYSHISHEKAADSVISIIKLIRCRWQSRLSLFKQIQALENKNIDCLQNINTCNDIVTMDNDNDDDDNDIGIDVKDFVDIPIRLSSSLVQWTSITWDEYISHPITQKFIDNDIIIDNSKLVNCNDMFYRAIITRGSAKLECLINISANFPTYNPIWALNLSWNGKQYDTLNNTAIKDIEYWINSSNMKKKSKIATGSSSSILSLQLKRCMSCLDIFLETEGPLYSPAEFTQEKTFLKAFRGRQRKRPYIIVQSGGSIFYKQF